jgi:hypothetical protein
LKVSQIDSSPTPLLYLLLLFILYSQLRARCQ